MTWFTKLFRRKEERQREEDLNLARMAWPTATMSDDGVILVNMAAEDRWRAENPDGEAIRKEMLSMSLRTRR